MRWSEKETHQFVKLYLNQESLWYTEHENYKVNEKRLQAYNEIIAKFHSITGITLSLSQLKAKIKNLRSTYTQELTKITKRSSNGYEYTPSVKWFAYWHKRFQRNSLPNKISDPMYEESEKDNSKMWNNEESDNYNNEQTNLETLISETDGDYILLLKNEPVEPLFPKTDINPYEIKRKKLTPKSSSTASEGSIQGSQDSNLDLYNEDEFDIYGKYIASQLRTMNLKTSLKMKLQIQKLVSEVRLSDLSND